MEKRSTHRCAEIRIWGLPQALLAPALCHWVLAGTSLGVESAYQTLLGYSGPAARDPLQESASCYRSRTEEEHSTGPRRAPRRDTASEKIDGAVG
jgi:hypothetical protein